jgi:hypothetical protein
MPLPTQEELFEILVDNLLGPKSVTVDGQTVTARDAKDFLDAAAVIAGIEGGEIAHRGLRFSQFVPPGSG